MDFTCRLLLWCTSVVPRSWRFLLVLFFVRMWRMNACERLMPPPERTVKRFAAPRLDFILGMTTTFPLIGRRTIPAYAGILQKPRLSHLPACGGVPRPATRGPALLQSLLRPAWPASPAASAFQPASSPPAGRPSS